MMLSEEDYRLMIDAVHTRDVSIIAHTILQVKHILLQMRAILDQYSFQSSLQIQTSAPAESSLQVRFHAPDLFV